MHRISCVCLPAVLTASILPDPTGQQQVSSQEAEAITAALQQQLEAARGEASGAQQLLFEAQAERNALQQQVEGLLQELSDARLQVEWMEGKVADLEAGHGTPQVGVVERVL